MAIDPRRSRLIGIVAAGTAVALLTGGQFIPRTDASDTIEITLLTEQVGTGIATGDNVRLDGVKVGAIESIEHAASGQQRIDLRLDRSQLFGLTDTLAVDYAAGNLFGISELVLHPGDGGTALRDATVVDLTGEQSGRAKDATISTLLRSVGQLTNDVFTPELTSMLSRIARDTKAFTPLIEAMVVTLRNYVETRQVPAAELLTQWGSALNGLPVTTQGLLDLLQAPFDNTYFVQDGKLAKFNANLEMVYQDFFGAVIAVLDTSRTHYTGYTAMLTPLLTAAAGTVRTPADTTVELRQLLERLRGAMPDTPDGPVLNLDVELRGVPGLAVPLAAVLPAPVAPTGGAR